MNRQQRRAAERAARRNTPPTSRPPTASERAVLEAQAKLERLMGKHQMYVTAIDWCDKCGEEDETTIEPLRELWVGAKDDAAFDVCSAFKELMEGLDVVDEEREKAEERAKSPIVLPEDAGELSVVGE